AGTSETDACERGRALFETPSTIGEWSAKRPTAGRRHPRAACDRVMTLCDSEPPKRTGSSCPPQPGDGEGNPTPGRAPRPFAIVVVLINSVGRTFPVCCAGQTLDNEVQSAILAGRKSPPSWG